VFSFSGIKQFQINETLTNYTNQLDQVTQFACYFHVESCVFGNNVHTAMGHEGPEGK
jgi:hypothetical protein